MISPGRAVRVFAYPRPADLRKGYNGLYGLVTQSFEADPLSGDLFLFVNRRRNSCKVLLFDGTGLCIFMKRLEQGQFADVWREDGDTISLTGSELSLFIEGCTVVGSRPLSPAPISSF